MNVLYIGPYKQSDGWGRASKDYLKALSRTSHNVASRSIWMGNTLNVVPNDDLTDKLESVVFDTKPDVVIQNVLPYYGEYQSDMKNILQMYLETSPLTHTNWPAHMKLFDSIWVPTTTEKEMVAENKVDVKTHVVPMPFDMENIDVNISPLDISFIDEEDFVFYFIGEYIERKNIEALMLAFHREFKPTERARLVIKTSLYNMNPQKLHQSILLDFEALYKRLRIYSQQFGYIREVVITEHLKYSDILALHKRCDCLIMPSHGESTCRPVIEALAMGNQVILTDNTGMASVAPDFVFKAKSTKEPVLCGDAPIPYLYTSNETWQNISVLDLQKQMRMVYDGHKKPSAREYLDDNFSYGSIAKRIEECIND